MRATSAIVALLACLTAGYGQSDSSGDIQHYQEQIKANPADSLAHYRLALTYFGQNNYQSAANEFREALNGNLQPKWVEVWAHIGLAEIFGLTGQQERATNEYRWAAETNDNSMQAQDVVAAFLEHRKTPEPPIAGPAAFRTHLVEFGPKRTEQTEPEYSEEGRAAGLEGSVFVRVGVGPDGSPVDARVSSPLGLGLDDKALEAVSHWHFTPPATGAQAAFALVPVNFLLPSKLSRWHLVDAAFEPPEGGVRPVFLTEPYPLGAGISDRAIDEGAVIAAIRRPATVTLRFDVNERGVPEKFQVMAASAALWGDEAIAVVSQWRFTPGTKDGEPVSVPCTLDLVWGQKIWTPELLAQLYRTMAAAEPRPVEATDPPPIVAIREIEDITLREPGSVVVSALIGEDGSPSGVQVLRGLRSEYNLKATEAVRQSHFQPAIVNGMAVPLVVLIEVVF